MPPHSDLLADNRRNRIVVMAVLVIATCVVYSNSFAGPFVFDDPTSIATNRTIRNLWSIRDVLNPPVAETVGGRPLLNLTFAINYALGGLDVLGYHVVNLCIHLLAGLTLFGVVRRTIARRYPHHNALTLAGVITLVWMLHPLQTESVTYIVQRAEAMVSFFYLLALYAFIRAVEAPADRRWVRTAVVACVAGVFCKEVMVTAPLTIILYDRAFVSGSFSATWRMHRRFHLTLAATMGLLLIAIFAMNGRGISAGFATAITPWSYALIQAGALLRYIGLAIWPHPLIFDYGRAMNTTLADNLPQFVGIVVLLCIAGYLLWKRPVVGFLAATFFIVLAPSSSVVPIVTQAVAEHRMYLSLATIIILVVFGLHRFIGQWVLPAGVAWALVLGWLTFQRNKEYQSDFALWSDTAEKLPTSARAHYNLGGVYSRLENREQAFVQFREAARLDPELATDRYSRALLLLNRIDEAKAQGNHAEYDKVMRLYPDSGGLHLTLARIFSFLDRQAEAVPQFEMALAVMPLDSAAHNEIGRSLGNLGMADEAIRHFETALRINPGFAEARSNLELAKRMRDARKP